MYRALCSSIPAANCLRWALSDEGPWRTLCGNEARQCGMRRGVPPLDPGQCAVEWKNRPSRTIGGLSGSDRGGRGPRVPAQHKFRRLCAGHQRARGLRGRRSWGSGFDGLWLGCVTGRTKGLVVLPGPRTRDCHARRPRAQAMSTRTTRSQKRADQPQRAHCTPTRRRFLSCISTSAAVRGKRF